MLAAVTFVALLLQNPMFHLLSRGRSDSCAVHGAVHVEFCQPVRFVWHVSYKEHPTGGGGDAGPDDGGAVGEDGDGDAAGGECGGEGHITPNHEHFRLVTNTTTVSEASARMTATSVIMRGFLVSLVCGR